MIRRSFLSFSCLAASCAFLFALATANADWSENFDGGFQQQWVFGSINATETGESPTFVAEIENDALKLSDPTAGTSNGAAVGFGVVTTEVFTDVLLTGHINPTNEELVSPVQTLIARGDVVNSTFYAAEIDYEFDSYRFIIFRNDGPNDANNLVEFEDTLPGGFATDAYVEFLIEGSNLTATLFDEPGGNQLASISAMDETYASGLSGVLSFNDLGDNLLGVFDNISSSDPSGPSGPVCDLDGDGLCGAADIDALYDAFGSAGAQDYDGNGTIGAEDIRGWLADASTANSNQLLAGDINLSGNIDSTDLGLLLNNFGATSAVKWAQGDLDGTGAVDSTDLGLLLNNFGHESPLSASAVPEPSSAALLAFAGLGLAFIRRQRR